MAYGASLARSAAWRSQSVSERASAGMLPKRALFTASTLASVVSMLKKPFEVLLGILLALSFDRLDRHRADDADIGELLTSLLDAS
jgi:hypothetical protein